MEDPIQVLVARGSLSKDRAAQIVARAQAENISIDTLLAEEGFSQEEILAARQGGAPRVPTRIIGKDKIPLEILQIIPEESARFYECVALGVIDGVLEVGLVNPDKIESVEAISFIARKNNMPFKIFHISKADFDASIAWYQGISGEVGVALDELESQMSEDQKSIQAEIDAQEKSKEAAQIREDAPMIKIVATILRYAVDGRASDIHIEPGGAGVKVRFRVDGILHTTLVLPKNTLQAIVARIKVLSSMRLDERRKPQDGNFTATISGHIIDFRVSTFPTPDGEKVVMRILDRKQGLIPVDQIGFTERNLAMVKKALKSPFGIILISGPTGSGKSTTLYSMLNELDKESYNVISLEDPVEYRMEGVIQSQVRPEIGYTFANGLRTTLRQDPDVIMVGEIRDGETAKLAVQAALTGHLVLSTIHTNDSAGVIPRLIDMGVDPYLIAPTLILSMAQRLVRSLCPGTGAEFPVSPSMRQMMEQSFSELPEEFRPKIPDVVYEPQPSEACPAGVRGRLAVFEMFTMNKDIEAAVLAKAGSSTIYPLLRKQGMLTLKEDAMLKAFDKKIPFSEISSLGLSSLSDTEEEKEKPAEV
jgi:type IV pilus assembly protein PilB